MNRNRKPFNSSLIKDKPVRVDEMIAFLRCGHLKVRPSDLMDFLLAQKASIAEEKQKRREAN